MSTAVVKRGARSTATPTGYGWAVPNWTYGPSQYAPGPRPAPRWPRSHYSVYGGGVQDFLTESSVLQIPNWALALAGTYALFKMHDGRQVPARTNPYGAFPLIPLVVVGGGIWAVRSFGGATTGYSGTGLYLGLALGALYAISNKESLTAPAIGGAVIGWAVGSAFERSQEAAAEAAEEPGILSKAWDYVV